MTDNSANHRREEITTRIEKLVPEAVRRLTPYAIPELAESDRVIKLDAMENPYQWPVELRRLWLRRLEGVAINRYPHPGAPTLKARLREIMKVGDDVDIILGNGSDELIQLVILAVGGSGSVVLAPEPSFVMYRMNSQAIGRRYESVDLDPEDFSLDTASMLDAIRRHQPALVFLAYPNNPTGNLYDRDAIEAIIDATPGVVVVDEAYAPFARQTFMGELGRYPNLLVMRTVSKLGLAGLRLGVLAAPPDWIRELEKLRLPYNVNVLTQVSAEFALEHYPVLEEQTERIRRDRGRLLERLSAFNRIKVWPSDANFLLVRVIGGNERIAADLRNEGVLVRNFHGASPLLEGCFRVSVGTAEENEAFVEALTRVLRHHPLEQGE